MFNVIKELIYNYYNANILMEQQESLNKTIEKNKEEATISELEYELLKEIIGELDK